SSNLGWVFANGCPRSARACAKEPRLPRAPEPRRGRLVRRQKRAELRRHFPGVHNGEPLPMICAPSKQKSVVSGPSSRLHCAPARQAVVRWNALQRFPVRRSLSTRLSFTRRLGGEGGNVITLQRCNAFTLIQLLVVMGIIAILMVLVAPTFTTIQSGGDVTRAAYTIKDVLAT